MKKACRKIILMTFIKDVILVINFSHMSMDKINVDVLKNSKTPNFQISNVFIEITNEECSSICIFFGFTSWLEGMPVIDKVCHGHKPSPKLVGMDNGIELLCSST